VQGLRVLGYGNDPRAAVNDAINGVLAEEKAREG
jgi:hypothetical protein